MKQYKTITINNRVYKFHPNTHTNQLKDFEQHIQNKGIKNLFNQIYGQITSDKEKNFRKFLNAIIKAENKPENKNKRVIIVKMKDRTIKLRPLLL